MAVEKGSAAEHLEHTVVSVLGMEIHMDTVILAGIAITALLTMIILSTRRLTAGVPGGAQNLMEVIVEFIENTVKENLPVYIPWITPLALTLFLYILFCNWLGEIPTMKSPTSDLNIPVSLAIITFILFVYYSFKYKGAKGYLSEFLFHPFGKWLIPVNVFMKVVEELAKPASLSLRLFGNMFAGEVMILLIAMLIPWYFNWTAGVVWLGWHMFVGLIQAFVFTILTIVYIAIAQQTFEEH
jgi:F-type H+-transporting ATPase subunit a